VVERERVKLSTTLAQRSMRQAHSAAATLGVHDLSVSDNNAE
jgi:hypothetical protein